MKNRVNDVVKASHSAPFRFRLCNRELDRTCPNGSFPRDERRELVRRAYFRNAAEARQAFTHFRRLQAFVDHTMGVATISGDVPACANAGSAKARPMPAASKIEAIKRWKIIVSPATMLLKLSQLHRLVVALPQRAEWRTAAILTISDNSNKFFTTAFNVSETVAL